MNLEPIKARPAAAKLQGQGVPSWDELARWDNATRDLNKHAPTDIAELVAEVERLVTLVRESVDGEETLLGWLTRANVKIDGIDLKDVALDVADHRAALEMEVVSE